MALELDAVPDAKRGRQFDQPAFLLSGADDRELRVGPRSCYLRECLEEELGILPDVEAADEDNEIVVARHIESREGVEVHPAPDALDRGANADSVAQRCSG